MQAGAEAGVGTAPAVVGDGDLEHAVGEADVDPGLTGLGVLAYVRQQLADGEVRGGLAGLGSP